MCTVGPLAEGAGGGAGRAPGQFIGGSVNGIDPCTAAAVGTIFTFVVLVWLKIVARTGHSVGGAIATLVLMAVPGPNLLVLGFLAFTEWPVERELRRLRSAERSGDPRRL